MRRERLQPSHINLLDYTRRACGAEGKTQDVKWKTRLKMLETLTDFLALFGDFCCFWWVFEHILSLPYLRRHTQIGEKGGVAPKVGKTQNVFKNSPKTTKITKKCQKITKTTKITKKCQKNSKKISMWASTWKTDKLLWNFVQTISLSIPGGQAHYATKKRRGVQQLLGRCVRLLD